MSNQITQEELKNVVSYDEKSGIFKWLERHESMFNSKFGNEAVHCRTWNSRYAGKRAGCIDTLSCGTKREVMGIKKRSHYSHRLAWLYVNGVLPPLEIDHIDGDSQNNSIRNLRSVTSQENSMNSSVPATNTSGVVGVSFCKRDGRWRAHIQTSGKYQHIGYFGHIFDAACARKSKEIELGFHANHGRRKLQK